MFLLFNQRNWAIKENFDFYLLCLQNFCELSMIFFFCLILKAPEGSRTEEKRTS